MLDRLVAEKRGVVDDEGEGVREDVELAAAPSCRPPRARPRRQRALREHEQRVGDEGEGDGERAGGDELVLKNVRSAVEDRLAEALGGDEGGDRRER